MNKEPIMKIQEAKEKVLKEFDSKFGSRKIDDGELRQYLIWEAFKTFLTSTTEEVWNTAQDEERDSVWKWIGENSWVQDSPTGEVRVIDVDELADYWRKNDRLDYDKKIQHQLNVELFKKLSEDAEREKYNKEHETQSKKN